jgi:hypothetical protein
MTSTIKGFHRGQSKNNKLQQLLTKTIAIGMVVPVLGAVALSQKLSPTPSDTTKFKLW